MFAGLLEYFGEAPVLVDGAADPYDAFIDSWAAGRSATGYLSRSGVLTSRMVRHCRLPPLFKA